MGRRLRIGRRVDERAAGPGGHFRPSLMVEVWIALLWYGGGWLDDLAQLRARRIRRLFGWVRIPDRTTFGRWLRRTGAALVPLQANCFGAWSGSGGRGSDHRRR